MGCPVCDTTLNALSAPSAAMTVPGTMIVIPPSPNYPAAAHHSHLRGRETAPGLRSDGTVICTDPKLRQLLSEAL